MKKGLSDQEVVKMRVPKEVLELFRNARRYITKQLAEATLKVFDHNALLIKDNLMLRDDVAHWRSEYESDGKSRKQFRAIVKELKKTYPEIWEALNSDKEGFVSKTSFLGREESDPNWDENQIRHVEGVKYLWEKKKVEHVDDGRRLYKIVASSNLDPTATVQFLYFPIDKSIFVGSLSLGQGYGEEVKFNTYCASVKEAESFISHFCLGNDYSILEINLLKKLRKV